MVLAEILSHKNFVLTRGWIYSTELPVVNTQIIRSVLFKFTDSWTAVRIWGNLVISLWMLFSYGFFVKQLDVDRKWFWYTSPFLLIPFSYEAFYMIGLMEYYTPYIAFSFTILGLWLYLYRQKEHRRIAHVALLLCSFLSCLGGIRQIEMTFLPMIMTMFFLVLEHSNEIGNFITLFRKTYYLWTSLLSSLVGYFINAKLFSKWFLFKDYGNMNLTQLTMEKIQIIVRAFLNAMGYTEKVVDVEVFSLDGILYLLSLAFLCMLVLLVFVLWKRRKKLLPESQFLLWFSLAGLFLNIFLFLFTEIAVSARYFILNIIMYVPLIIVFYRESGLALEVRRFYFFAMVLLICLFGGKEYKKCLQSTANEARNGHIAYLLENQYTLGYANFWNANVLTELTEGKIEMVSLNCEGKGTPTLNPWLVKLENIYPPVPRKDVFLLLHENERRRSEKLIEGREPVFESEGYYIYLYDDTDEFLDLLHRSEEEEHGE